MKNLPPWIYIRTIIITVIVLMGWADLSAQAPDQYFVSHIELPDVYSNRNNNDIILDHRGTIWIANHTGLYLYDGVQCRLFHHDQLNPSLTGSIFALAEDSDKRLWIHSQAGLLVLDASRTSLLPPTKVGIPDSIAMAPNFHFCRGQGQQILILAGSNIYTYSEHKLRPWAHYEAAAMHKISGGEMKYSIQDSLVYFYSVKQRVFLVADAKGYVCDEWLFNYPNGFVQKISLGELILVTTNAFGDSVAVYSSLKPSQIARIEQIDPTQCTFTASFLEPEADGYTLRTIFQAYQNKYNKSIQEDLVGDFKIFALNEHILALACYEGIILVQRRTDPKFQQVKPSLGHRIRAIQQDMYGHLIYGTYKGTFWSKREADTATPLSSAPSCTWSILQLNRPANQFVLQGEDTQNKLYFLHTSPAKVSLSHIDSLFGPAGLQSFNTCMVFDSCHNGFWHVAGDHYLTFFNLITRRHHTLNPSLAHRGEKSMALGSSLWIGGTEGLMRFEAPDPHQTQLKDITHTIPKNIRALSINALHLVADSCLWIGTNTQGLFCYYLQSGQYQQFTTDDGLAENSVFSILAEKDAPVFWLGTGRGLSRFDLNAYWFDNYFAEDGLSHQEFNTASVYQAADGTIYMGGQNGINYFNPKSFRTSPAPLKQYAIINMSGADPLRNIKDLFVSPSAKITVKPYIYLIEINFRTDNHLHAPKIQFRYRIPGLIDTWQYLDNQRKATFTKLPSGQYTLEAQARSHRGMWLPPVQYTLNVLPPWYQTWWFRLLALSSIVAALYGLYQMRIRQIKHDIEMRKSISDDLHDDLGTRLYLLKNLARKIIDPSNSNEKRQAEVSHFEQLTQNTLQTVRDFIWAFDPQNDGVLVFVDRLQDFVDNFIRPSVPSVHWTQSDISPDKKADSHHRHQVLQIFQELLTNMVKHTHTKQLDINLQIVKNELMIRCTNIHQGYRQASEDSSGKGSESMRERLQSINGALHWHETDGLQQVTILIHSFSK